MNSSEKPEEPGRLLAEDHGELGELLRALLAGLDGGDAASAFSALDLLRPRG